MDTRKKEFEYPPRPGPRMRDLPANLRPREAVRRVGVEHATDAQLLALLIKTGRPGLNALQIAESILKESRDSLHELAAQPASELARRFPGIGPVKAQTIQAAMELGRRLAQTGQPDKPAVRTPEDAAQLLRERARNLEQEKFWVIPLDVKYRLKAPPREITAGLLNASLAHPREVFKEAVRLACAAVILAHNHPSGDPAPSAEDLRITRQIVAAGRVLGIEVLDHVILGRPCAGSANDFISLREANLVDFQAVEKPGG